jgi:hypothetical protein
MDRAMSCTLAICWMYKLNVPLRLQLALTRVMMMCALLCFTNYHNFLVSIDL